MPAYELNITEILARIRADLRIGVPVLLRDGNNRAIAVALEVLLKEGWERFRSLGDEIFLVLSHWRAKTLKIPVYDGVARVKISKDVDFSWLKAVIEPAKDFDYPLKGPFQPQRGEEVGIYKALLSLIKKTHLLPACLVIPLSNKAFDEITLTGFSTLDLDKYWAFLEKKIGLEAVAAADLPLAVHPNARLHVFRMSDGVEEHYALEIGAPPLATPPLVRVHSACFTGDLLGSLKCDCGLQLKGTLSKMGEEGSGVLLYLNQEGRGIGLANKMRAYFLQNQGFDTVEANNRLGFEDDERDFRIGSEILKALGYDRIRLMTNNPQKIEMMRIQAIEVVERVSLCTHAHPENQSYLDTKRKKFGHML